VANNPKTQFLTNDSLTRKRWARDLFAVLLPAVEFNDLTGSGSSDIVQIRTELGKGEGDNITFGIRLPLLGEGVVGDDTVEGNEERLRFRNFAMTIQELNHAVDTGGKMEEQRVPYNLMQEGKDGLQEWWAAKLSDYLINTLIGNSAYLIAGKTFAQACVEPDTDHHMAVNQADATAVATAEAAITSADVIDLAFLDRMKQRAEMPYSTSSFKVRPMMRNGKAYYRVLMNNYVFDALRQNTNIGQWGDLLRAAGKLQMPYVEIEYNGMLISKSERIPKMLTVGTGGVYRTILLGAQAACWAWGGAGDSKSTVMSFVPYTKDAERYVMIRGGGIFGMKKTTFDSKDYGVVTGSSYGVRMS
jgi:N4-gp56 family major capsid protein